MWERVDDPLHSGRCQYQFDSERFRPVGVRTRHTAHASCRQTAAAAQRRGTTVTNASTRPIVAR
jgi:hypothetical protein